MCISRALSFTKVHLPNSRGMADDQRVVNSYIAAAFLQIMLNIPNHYFDDEESRSVLGISRT